jgi:hypothetical protein
VLEKMAGTTGLEPAASAVTGQRSNQLNYVPFCVFTKFAANQRIYWVSSLSTLSPAQSLSKPYNRIPGFMDTKMDTKKSWFRSPLSLDDLCNPEPFPVALC